MRHHSAGSQPPGRRLLVADWRLDPQAVVDAAAHQPATGGVALLVPAKLNGIDWAGDPHASVPCAQRQLDRITELADHSGIRFTRAGVGDPEPLAAICDALAEWPSDDVMLCIPRGRLTVPYPFDLRSRARRATGLVVHRLELPMAPRLRRGHCALEPPQFGLAVAAPR